MGISKSGAVGITTGDEIGLYRYSYDLIVTFADDLPMDDLTHFAVMRREIRPGEMDETTDGPLARRSQRLRTPRQRRLPPQPRAAVRLGLRRPGASWECQPSLRSDAVGQALAARVCQPHLVKNRTRS